MNMRVFVVTILMGSGLSLFAGDWQQWRGPMRDGVDHSLQIPEKLGPPQKIWSVETGEGHSTPVIKGNRVYLLTRKNNKETVTAYSKKDGKIIWEKAYDAPFEINGYATSHGKGPKATPLVSGNYLATVGIGGIITVFAADTGKILWQKSHFEPAKIAKGYVCPPCGMECDNKVYDKPGACPREGCNINLTAKGSDTAGLFCGMASSPILLGNRLIIHAGNDKRGAVVAYQLENGKLIWERKGPGPGYSSPVMMHFGGEDQLVTLTNNSIVSIDPENGRHFWELDFPDEYNENIITPVAYKDTLIVSSTKKALQSFIVGRRGDAWTLHRKWFNLEVFLYMSSPVISDGYLYGLNKKKKGSFFCVDPETGTVIWATEGRKGNNASLVVTGNKILTLSTDGHLRVYATGNKEKLLGEYVVSNNPVWAHLAPSGRGFFVKNKDSLTLWGF